MSKRLQVLLSELEIAEIQKFADLERVSVGEWVRRALRDARSRRSSIDPQSKLKSVRKAAAYSFPTADVGQMLAEIERGW
jgi:hypothetical protein